MSSRPPSHVSKTIVTWSRVCFRSNGIYITKIGLRSSFEKARTITVGQVRHEIEMWKKTFIHLLCLYYSVFWKKQHWPIWHGVMNSRVGHFEGWALGWVCLLFRAKSRASHGSPNPAVEGPQRIFSSLGAVLSGRRFLAIKRTENVDSLCVSSERGLLLPFLFLMIGETE